MASGAKPANLPDMVARIALRPNVRQMAAFPGSEYSTLLTESVGIVVSLSPQIAHLDPGKPDRSQLARLAQRLRPLGCREGTAGARDHPINSRFICDSQAFHLEALAWRSIRSARIIARVSFEAGM